MCNRHNEQSEDEKANGRDCLVPDVCFYHSADFDGKCSAAIIKRKFPDRKMIGIDYGEPFPWKVIAVGCPSVVMVDFSLPIDDMITLSKICMLTWIDHHITAIEAYADRQVLYHEVVLDNEKAACELTWEYYHPGETVPAFVQLLGRYDVWDDENPLWETEILPFQYGLRVIENTEPDAPIWTDFIGGHYLDDFIFTGKQIIKYRNIENTKYIMTHGFQTKLDGLKAIAINRGLGNSGMFDGVYNEHHYDIMIAFSWVKDKWKVSLYTTKETINVGAIAQEYGGGGHLQAAGFHCYVLPFTVPTGKGYYLMPCIPIDGVGQMEQSFQDEATGD